MKTIKITNLNDEVTEWCKVKDVIELMKTGKTKEEVIEEIEG